MGEIHSSLLVNHNHVSLSDGHLNGGKDTLSNGKNSWDLDVKSLPQYSASTTDGSTEQSLKDLLYSSNAYAKVWKVASQSLSNANPPILYPEYTKPGGNKYVYRDLEFWTSGFFPGSLYLLLERERKFNKILRSPTDTPVATPHQLQLEFACKWWTLNLHQNASLATTHDLGFMIFPWAKLAWELNHDTLAYNTIKQASKTLASRYVPQVGAIRSWDTCVTKRYSFLDPKQDFLVIIDNMVNIDMLFWTASELQDKEMYEVAVNHARKSRECHVRPDFSTAHVAHFDPVTGAFRSQITNQGYSDESSWSRGQAWAITGFAQTFKWTRDVSFLETAQSCADYFLQHLPDSRIPPWDFTAPKTTQQPPDTSAAIIAVYGMLLIHEARVERGEESRYFAEALEILKNVCARHLNSPDKFESHQVPLDTVESFQLEHQAKIGVENCNTSETILGGATINNYEYAPRRWANHGLVYADYYFLLVGNKLLEMGALEMVEKTVV